MTHNTDVPDAADDDDSDSPNDAEYDDACHKSIYLSLINLSRTHKIASNTQKQYKEHDPQD